MASSRYVTTAAVLFVAVTMIVVLFQMALAMGAPLGHLTMGGAFRGRLSAVLSVVVTMQAVLLMLFCLIVTTRARLILPRWHHVSRRLVWVVVAYCVVGTILNAITPSGGERALWLPAVLVLAVCAIVVARSR